MARPNPALSGSVCTVVDHQTEKFLIVTAMAPGGTPVAAGLINLNLPLNPSSGTGEFRKMILNLAKLLAITSSRETSREMIVCCLNNEID